MAKPIKCYIRLHGATREIPMGEFSSISEARKWVRECWDRPYTIVRKKDLQVTK